MSNSTVWLRVRALLLLVALCALGHADEVDDIVKAEMAKQRIPGVALAVIKDGRLVRSSGYGLANVELNVPVTPRTVFKIGSISKQFIASGVMILAQEGKIDIDASVRKYVEEAPPEWEPITLRRMMSHTAGLIREGPAFDPLKMAPDIQVIRSAFPVALLSPPGTGWRYSNIAYFTLAEIISRVSGEPWTDFIAHRIFRPLDMTSSRTTSWRDLVPDRADGYEPVDGGIRRAEEYRALRPSGAFLSTVEDLARWDAALYKDAPLTKASRDEMWRPVMLNDGSSSAYGLGWEIQTRGGKRSVHHGGSLPGFRAHIARFPDERLSFVVLANAGPSSPSAILWKVAALWLPGVDRAPNNGRPLP
jgi:D-alanyl-D-alanine carboxypeptidase